MKLSTLKQNICPKCGGELVRTMVSGSSDSINCQCGFHIRRSQYQHIIQQIKEEEPVSTGDDLEERYTGYREYTHED